MSIQSTSDSIETSQKCQEAAKENEGCRFRGYTINKNVVYTHGKVVGFLQIESIGWNSEGDEQTRRAVSICKLNKNAWQDALRAIIRRSAP